MRILVLTKRQYTGRDLLDDRYGRLFEIPEQLALCGHQVAGLAASYRRCPPTEIVTERNVRWTSVNAWPLGPWGWRRAAQKLIERFRPDVIWASSDALHCIAAVWLATHCQRPVVLDLYDNYDHFGLTRLPGIRRAYHAACRRATGLTVVSHTLADHVRHHVAPNTPATVVINGVRKDIFRPLDRMEARAHLGLPLSATIIGTAGAITEERGISDLFDAFLQLASQDSSIHLAYAGPRDKTPSRYHHPRIIDLGMLPWTKVPLLINALDIVVICNRESTFGRYCFPLKLQEARSCGVSVVAASVGDTVNVLHDQPGALYPPGKPALLAQAIDFQMQFSQQTTNSVPDWKDIALDVQQALLRATQASKI